MLLDDRVYHTPKWTKSLGKGLERDMLTILDSMQDHDLIVVYHWDKGCKLEYRLSSLNGDDFSGRATIIVTNDGCLSVELSVLDNGYSRNHYTEWDRYDQPTRWESIFFGMLDERGIFVDEG